MTEIKVYTKSGCPQCEFTKRFLDNEKLTYELINVEENEKALRYVKEELGFTSMPVVEVGDQERFAGFQPSKLQKIKR